MRTPPSPPILSYDAAVEFLFGRINYERVSPIPQSFKLDRMRELSDRLGKLHQGLPVVHVAGSKGKGSTSRFIAEILRAAGYRVGMYTSPHLQRVEERIWLDGNICLPEQFAALTAEIEPVVRAMDGDRTDPDRSPTYFEIMTAMAMLHFRQAQVDLAVLEVGLGGRLDSTNICEPACCVITSISLDHTKQLGSTLAEIAAEKAGIVKDRVPVVSGVVQPQPAAVIEQTAARHAAPLLKLDRDFGPTQLKTPPARPPASPRMTFDFEQRTPAIRLAGLETSVLGTHQAANAAVACATATQLRDHGWTIPDAALRAGVAATAVPARIEVLQSWPPVILDTAHNDASMHALVATLDTSWPDTNKAVILGTTRGKSLEAMLSILTRWADRLILTPYLTNPRSCSTAQLNKIVSEVQPSDRRLEVHQVRSPVEAWQHAWPPQENQLTCITGSFFLAGEIRPLILQQLEVHS
ncbi:MAG: folylpolyglutamate synthase/dihydrofolate synthase family protein [Planctomycetota bacterium]